MKNLIKILFSVVLISTASCKKTKTTPIDTTDYLPKIIGSYNFKQKCGIDPAEFNFTTITKSATISDGIVMKNFGNLSGEFVYATVSGRDITIAKQIVIERGALTIFGTGVYDGIKTITWDFTVSNSDGIVGTCSSTGSKQ